MARWLGIGWSLFHLYTAGFGLLSSHLQRTIHFAFALLLLFLWTKPRRTDAEASNRIPWYDWLMIAGSLAALLYLIVFQEHVELRFPYIERLTKAEVILGSCFVLAILEGTRRRLGNALFLVGLAFFLYPFYGKYLFGIFRHNGYAFTQVLDNVYLSAYGVFSLLAGVSATYLYLFVLFGALLEHSNAGSWLVGTATALTGRYRGGPAKAAIVGSALLGTITGSPTANVVTSGSITIPLMKRTGYPPAFAAAVEAAASTGGQIMPPIMGIAAFLIAEFTGMAYIQVAMAAAIPALLYFTGLFFIVDFRAARIGLQALPRAELPALGPTFWRGVEFIIPLLVIVGLLVLGKSPMYAGFWGTVAVVGASLIRPHNRLKWHELLNALEAGARSMAEIATIVMLAGMIIGIVTLTGVGHRFTQVVLSYADTSWLALGLTMLVSIILGMGMPTTAAYVLQVAVVLPALQSLGVPVLAAHLFIFYFACMSAVTPPVAVAAIAGAGIAGASPTRTALDASRLAAVGFIVPYMFVFGPALLLEGTVLEIVFASATALVGTFALAGALEGWFLRAAAWPARLILLAAALLLIKPGWATDSAGVALIGAAFLLQRLPGRLKEGSAPAAKG